MALQNLTTEHIVDECGTGDTWVCLCGNQTHLSGFYPCTKKGKYVEPVKGLWGGLYYKCAQCGRIINQDNLEVAGINKEGTEAEGAL